MRRSFPFPHASISVRSAEGHPNAPPAVFFFWMCVFSGEFPPVRCCIWRFLVRLSGFSSYADLLSAAASAVFGHASLVFCMAISRGTGGGDAFAFTRSPRPAIFSLSSSASPLCLFARSYVSIGATRLSSDCGKAKASPAPLRACIERIGGNVLGVEFPIGKVVACFLVGRGNVPV